MLSAVNITVEQEVIVAGIKIALFRFTRFWCTQTHVQSKPSREFALTFWPPKYCRSAKRLCVY